MSSRGPTDGAGADGTEPVPDAEWEAFQQEAEDSVRRPSQAGSAPREPSARARMVTARLRERDEAAAAQLGRRFGRRKKEPEPWQPEGWRTGPAWQEMQGGRAGRRRSRRAGVVLVTLAVLGGGLWFAVDRGYVDLGPLRAGGSGGPDAEPLAAETARPTAAPSDPAFAGLPTLSSPWEGSPARRWAEGADAIELPAAKQTGQISADRMAEELKAVKSFLVASHLDREVLHGAKPERALDLLDPLQKELVTDVRDQLSNPTQESVGSTFFTRFDGDEVRLVGDAVKVRGRTTAEEWKDGRARIRADYSFVYALRHADDREEVTRVVVRRQLTTVVLPQGWAFTPGKLWIFEWRSELAGVACEPGPDGYIRPDFPSELVGNPDGPTVDPYDRSRKLRDEGSGCRVVTRV